MTDTIDRAGDYVDEWNEAMVNAARPPAPTGPSSPFCFDCFEEIPEARRNAVPGCKRCFSCESDRQKREVRRG